MSHINIYDLNWNFVREFWSGNCYGIKEVGDIKREGKFYFKRMS